MDLVARDPSGAAVWLRSNADGGLTTAYESSATITRPANVTAYTAGDVLGGAFQFANFGPLGGRMRLVSASLRADIAAIPAGMTNFRLHLYNVTPPSAIADNAAFDLPAGDRAAYLGYIDLGNMVDLGATLLGQLDNISKQVKLASTSLFGYLVTTGGFTPAANSEVYTPTLAGVSV
jgi:hypothetical protein